jgi:hypothetical protein
MCRVLPLVGDHLRAGIAVITSTFVEFVCAADTRANLLCEPLRGIIRALATSSAARYKGALGKHVWP